MRMASDSMKDRKIVHIARMKQDDALMVVLSSGLIVLVKGFYAGDVQDDMEKQSFAQNKDEACENIQLPIATAKTDPREARATAVKNKFHKDSHCNSVSHGMFSTQPQPAKKGEDSKPKKTACVAFGGLDNDLKIFCLEKREVVWKAKNVFVSKRGQGTGYSGIENPLFFKDNTRMFYGDAKKSLDDLLQKIG